MRTTHIAGAFLALAATALFACGQIEDRHAISEIKNGVVDVPPGEDGCTLTQGFWKNHEEAWPVDSLTIGGESYSAADLLKLLKTPTKGDASLILGHQLIAARLNVEQGASVPPEVQSALDDADAWMSANKDADGRLPYGVPSSAAAEAIALSETLADFNEGGIGPGHCDDASGSTGGTGGAGGTGGGGTGGGETGGGGTGGGETGGTGGGGTGGSTGTGGGCAQACGENNTEPCPQDHVCINGCCVPAPN